MIISPCGFSRCMSRRHNGVAAKAWPDHITDDGALVMGKLSSVGPYLIVALLAVARLAAEPPAIDERLTFSGPHSQSIELNARQTVEISVGLLSPSKLPANGRLAVEWKGVAA